MYCVLILYLTAKPKICLLVMVDMYQNYYLQLLLNIHFNLYIVILKMVTQ